MSTHLKDANEWIKLPAVLAIGFSGHRQLLDEAASRKIIHGFLAEQKRDRPETLVGVSSLAACGDLLFAESCIALDIAVRVLLPLPQNEFRKDFDIASWNRVQYVIDRALSVEVTGEEGQRDERYYECGLASVLQTQWQIALWDGQVARGLGGTEQIVSFARQIGRRVILINSLTGAVLIEEEKKQLTSAADRELKFLNHLKPFSAKQEDNFLEVSPHTWLAKLDVNAVLVAPQVRRLAALPIVCTALAALVSGGASRVQDSSIWVAVGAAIGLAAAVLPAMLRLGKRQALWVRIRTAAEVSRSVCALWNMPSSYEVVGPEILPELESMIVSLNFVKSKARNAVEVNVELFKTTYLKERLLDQKLYFLRQAKKAYARGRRYRLIGKVCVICAITISVFTFSNRMLLKSSAASVLAIWLPLVASALFQGATIAGALLVVNDCDRRQRRYMEIHEALVNWELELVAFRSWPPVIKVVNKIERALLVELLEWRSLLQNTKMPRN